MRCAITCRKAAAEAYQRHFHIVKQTRPRSRGGVLTGDENVVSARDAQKRQKDAGRLAEATAGPVADHRSADLLGRGKSLANSLAVVRAAAALDNQQAAAFGKTARNVQEFAPYPQAFERQRGGIAIGRQRALSARRRRIA